MNKFCLLISFVVSVFILFSCEEDKRTGNYSGIYSCPICQGNGYYEVKEYLGLYVRLSDCLSCKFDHEHTYSVPGSITSSVNQTPAAGSEKSGAMKDTEIKTIEEVQNAANKLSEYVKEVNYLLENAEEGPEDYSIGPFAVQGRFLTCEMFWFHEYLITKTEYAETCMDWAIRMDPSNKMLRAAYHAGYSFKIFVEIDEPNITKELTFDNSIFESVLPKFEHKK